MTAIEFTAHAVTIHEEDQVLYLEWAAGDDPAAERFSMQQALFDDELGPYCERNEPDGGCYGAIRLLVLTRTQLWVEFSERGLARLGCGALRIAFELDEPRYAQLQSTLRRMQRPADLLWLV